MSKNPSSRPQSPNDIISQIIVKTMPLLSNGERVALDEWRIREEILPPNILSRIFVNEATKFHQEYLDSYLTYMRQFATPVITTPITHTDLHKRFMIHRPRTTFSTDNIAERMIWEGIQKSFKASGANCTAIEPDECDPTALLWPRDPCLIIGHIAFFPDPKLMYIYTKRDRVKDAQFYADRLDAWIQCRRKMGQQGLKTIVVDGYFEGGNLVVDDENGFLFCGVAGGNYKRENISGLCEAIMAHTDYNLTPVYVPVDGTRHPHLDMAMSPQLPNGKFIVCENLGPLMDGEGFKVIEKHLGRDAIYSFVENAKNKMTANLSIFGNGLMMTACDEDLKRTLEDDGMIVNAPSDDLLKGTRFATSEAISCREIGLGGAHCLTNEVLIECLVQYQHAKLER